ncbi:MAG TPA: tRNA (adenosine(37)-N6)-dimethylallyltransferase MiaA [Candidatus Hydrogenedens sp.]|nr:tRNA (adenosine(37)-N6)-dimethylallyltransferase MiaA [Candidatus Hydrogenedens sp.]
MIYTNEKQKSIIILGATASGKTRLGVRIAHEFQGEILSADSRQVYIGLDIGTGKDIEEYFKVSPPVSYHLIDIVPVSHEFSLYEYLKYFNEAYQNVLSRGNLPIIVGGTGLYIEALIEGYSLAEITLNETLRSELFQLSIQELQQKLLSLKPKLHNTTDLLDKERLVRAIEIAIAEKEGKKIISAPKLSPIILGVRYDREHLKLRIGQRLKERLQHGLIEEVERLRTENISDDRLFQLGLEYRYVLLFLQGKIKNKNDLFQKLQSAIWEFSRKQEIWFRRLERKGYPIYWIRGNEFEKAEKCIKDNL